MVHRKILIIAVLGLLASGIFAFSSDFAMSAPDSVQYDKLGLNLANGNWFSLDTAAPFKPTMFREPGYPAFLAAVYTVFGHNVKAVIYLQMLLHALTAVLVYFIAREIFDSGVALFSGVVTAVFPTLANMTSYLLSETLFTFLLCLSLWYYSKSVNRQSFIWSILSGIAFGAMALTKAAALLLPLALILAAIVISIMKRRGIKKLVICSLIMALTFSLTVSGWIVRNMQIFGSTSLTLRGGEALWSRAQKLDDSKAVMLATAGYSVSEYVGYRLFPHVTDRPERFLFKDFEKAEALRKVYASGGLSDPEIEDRFKNEAVAKIVKRPIKYAAYTLIEAIKMTAFTYLPVLNEPAIRNYAASINNGAVLLSGVRGAIRLLAYPILALIIASIVRYLKIWDRWFLLLAVVVYFNLIYSLLDAIGRYAVPLIPLYCIMAVAALVPASQAKGFQKG